VTLLENLGNEIAALQLDCKAKTEVFTNIEKGHFLDHILANCPQLEYLRIVDTFLAHCSPALPVKKKHLDSLTLSICGIYPSFFNELSPLLPSLGSLYFF
jgi:hypothetical protein